MQENRDNKPWEGQLYLCHSSAIVCKLLYKKFFRKTDTTVIYGQWKQVLLQQQRVYGQSNSKEHVVDDEDIDPILSPPSVHRTASVPNNAAAVNTSGGIPAMEPTFFLPLSPQVASPVTISQSYSSLPTLYERRMKKSILNTPMHERTKLVATSKHGLISPGELEPIQCLVLHYTSSWRIPKLEAASINRVFGPAMVPKIEMYIREEFNGEQIPGTSFVIETGQTPCKFIVCTSVAKDPSLLSVDYAYNSFRSSLFAIYNYNRQHLDNQITSILCPALESITLPPYNLVHQMAVCYEYWDWHVYAQGAVLPFTHKDEDHICKQMRMTSPALQRISADLEQFIKLGLIVQRGFVYDMELQVLLGWLTDNGKPKPAKKDVPPNQIPIKSDLSKATLAQALVDVLKKPDAPPFTLTPMQICVGLTGDALDCVLQLAKDNKIKIFDEIDPKQLVYGDVLAHGTSGSVSKAMWNDVPVAVKIFFSYQPELFFNELTMITLVRHPKLVEAIGGYYDKNNAIIVTELLDTNLCQFLATRKDLNTRLKLKIATDIAEAMNFLHSRNIIHRDLKSVNVLLNCGLDIVAKVCDFGLSRVADNTSTMTGNIGTVSWIAPEIFENKRYTEKCDVYSFGIILFEIMSQHLPYKEIPTFKIPMVVVKGQRPAVTPEQSASMPREYTELMKMCWHDNPSKRPSFAQIIEKLAGMAPSAPPPKSVTALADGEEDESTSSDNLSTSSGTTNTNTSTDHENAALEELKQHYKRSRPLILTDDLMRKCLRVRHNKVAGAKQIIRSYLEWYQLFNQGKALKVSDVRNILEAKILYFLDGAYDMEGRALAMIDFTTFDRDRPSEPDFIKAFMYVVERASATVESQTKGVVLIILLNNFNTSSVSFRLVNSVFAIIRKCYPLNIKRILCVNPPPSFSRFLTMYQVFIKNTMRIIETMPQEKLQLYINTEQIPTDLGGKLQYDVGKWIRSRYEAENIEYI